MLAEQIKEQAAALSRAVAKFEELLSAAFTDEHGVGPVIVRQEGSPPVISTTVVRKPFPEEEQHSKEELEKIVTPGEFELMVRRYRAECSLPPADVMVVAEYHADTGKVVVSYRQRPATN